MPGWFGAVIPTLPGGVRVCQDGPRHFFSRFSRLKEGGPGGLKLFGQCPYRTNTFQKGASLINSPNSSAVWELRAMSKFHESNKHAREKNSPCLIISSEAEIGQGELDDPTCLDSPPGQVIIQATCTKTTNIYRGQVPSLPSVFERKHQVLL